MKTISTLSKSRARRSNYLFSRLVFLTAILMLPWASLKAQAIATIGENYSITLNEGQPLDKDYIVDLSTLEIEDDAQFLSLFKMMNDNSIMFVIDLEIERMEIKIMYDTPMGTPMNVKKWNEHLAAKLRRSKMVIKMK